MPRRLPPRLLSTAADTADAPATDPAPDARGYFVRRMHRDGQQGVVLGSEARQLRRRRRRERGQGLLLDAWPRLQSAARYVQDGSRLRVLRLRGFGLVRRPRPCAHAAARADAAAHTAAHA